MNKKIFIKVLILQVFVVSCFCVLSKLAIAADPTVSSFSPADNDTYVASSTDLIIVFSENVFAGSGNIYIKKSDDDSVFEAIDVISAQVIINGATTTISLNSLMERGVAYYIQIDSTCFKNTGEEYYAGISNTATWDFIVRNDLYVAELVKDINESGNSSPSNLAIFNNELYFRANDGINGTELWKSDGTALGTIIVKDINEGSGNSDPTSLTVFNNELYFEADDGTNDDELWKSDGTALGTVMVKNIHGSYSSNPNSFIIFNSELYFEADDGINGKELWKSDGTASGTVMVKDINGSGDSDPNGYTPNGFLIFNNELYFEADDGTNGDELWKSDGTASGTVMVKDINGSGNSDPTSFTIFNSELYFEADDGTNGDELWKSDGTASGTVMVKDINGSGNSDPISLTVFNSELYFRANDGINGIELWKSDGTASGTVMVKDINGSGNSSPSYLAAMNNEIYFLANDGTNGTEFWKSDGTALGTVMVKDINESGNSGVRGFIILDNELYIQADDGINGLEPWKSDGTEKGTVMLADINNSGSSLLLIFSFTFFEFNNKLYFQASNGISGQELWKTYKITEPTVTSVSSVSVTQNSAVVSGSITDIGMQNNSERGFVYSSTSSSPTINGNKERETGSFGVGSFSATVSGLFCATTYYFRAYSINRAGASYGNAVSFTTSACSSERAFLPSEALLPPEKPQETMNVLISRGSETFKEEVIIDDFKIIINNEEKETYSIEVNLELITGTNTEDMAISENSDFENISLEPYQRNKKYVLSDNEGEKTIYVKFYTKWGQASKIVSSSISYKKVSVIEKEESGKEVKKEAFFDISNFLGRIIFQTENRDKMWYINPADQKKYSVENPFRMFNVMSYLSLGAIHEYIDKYLEFPKRVLGRIILDVEINGEAYYINPIDKKKYYLGRPNNAFNIIKGFSIGISNSDIERIETGK